MDLSEIKFEKSADKFASISFRLKSVLVGTTEEPERPSQSVNGTDDEKSSDTSFDKSSLPSSQQSSPSGPKQIVREIDLSGMSHYKKKYENALLEIDAAKIKTKD